MRLIGFWQHLQQGFTMHVAGNQYQYYHDKVLTSNFKFLFYKTKFRFWITKIQNVKTIRSLKCNFAFLFFYNSVLSLVLVAGCCFINLVSVPHSLKCTEKNWLMAFAVKVQFLLIFTIDEIAISKIQIWKQNRYITICFL